MFERFTDRARRVVVIAQEEARLLNHRQIGTEHILLGAVAEGEGVAAQALAGLGVTREALRERVAEMVGKGEQPPSEMIPFTAEAKDALEMALRESIQLGHNYIGTEHVLLGVLALPDSVGSQALLSLGIDAGSVREKIGDILGDSGEQVVTEPPPPPMPVSREAGTSLERQHQDPALVSVVFVLVALVAVQVQPPAPEVSRWGLALLLGGVLLWAGGAVIGAGKGPAGQEREAGRYLRFLGGLTLAAAASVFVLGALLV